MKIGILTFHKAYNYGAALQCYALQQSIKTISKENDVEIVNYINENVMDGYRVFPKNKRNIKYYMKCMAKYILYGNKTKRKYAKFDDFIKRKYSLSRNKYDNKNFQNIAKEYEILITGSDQVWNPSIVGELSDVYSLNFEKENINKISYAASIGDASQVKDYEKDFRNKIGRLNHISVRENAAKLELEKIIENPISVVLDPTLLLDRQQWKEEIKECKSKEEKYILAYVVEADEEYKKIVNYLSEVTGLKVIHFERVNRYNNILENAYTEGPLEFVNHIKNAEYVVATSFHATVFSIIFNKKFFIIPHKKTGARVTNLLEKLEIKNRTFNSLEEFKNIDYDFATDWKCVNTKLEEEREKSLTWLKNAINS